MFATYLYSSPGRRQPPRNISSYEKTTIDKSSFENQAEPTIRSMDTASVGSGTRMGRAASENRRAKRED
jgi:hypothetical protein